MVFDNGMLTIMHVPYWIRSSALLCIILVEYLVEYSKGVNYSRPTPGDPLSRIFQILNINYMRTNSIKGIFLLVYLQTDTLSQM